MLTEKQAWRKIQDRFEKHSAPCGICFEISRLLERREISWGARSRMHNKLVALRRYQIGIHFWQIRLGYGMGIGHNVPFEVKYDWYRASICRNFANAL